MAVRVFEGEAKISTAPDSKDFSVETERFSPLLDKSMMFYFKARSMVNWSTYDACSGGHIKNLLDFLLTLVWSPDSKCYPSLITSVDVSVYYSDGTLLKKYEPQSNIKVDDMNSFDFETVTKDYSVSDEFISTFRHHSKQQLDHLAKMRKGKLTLRYKMSFNHVIPKTTLQCKKFKFANNLKCVYESAVFNDFVFNVGDKTFPVHRVILVAHSPVFMKMMTQDFKESKINSTTITDATPEIFELFLKYLYYGEIEDKSWPSVKDLYCLADKYDVGILKNDCTDIIISLLSLDLVCEILKLAYIYDDSSIKSAARLFSVNHIRELISREDWKELVVARPIIGYEIIVNFVPT